MKEVYYVKSNRYGHTHKFIKNPKSEYYCFIPEKDWMPLYVTYKSDGTGVLFLDTDGGPLLEREWKNDEIKISEILLNDNGIEFKLEEICVGKEKRKK